MFVLNVDLGNMMKRIKSMTPPTQDYLASVSRSPFFRDAICITPKKSVTKPDQAQVAIFGHMPKWVSAMMRVRNTLVKSLGFEVGQLNVKPTNDFLKVGDQVGFMHVIEKNEYEIISYAEDKHMAFYLSTKIDNDAIVLSTLVNKKTFIGRCYVNFIIPFHYFIARAVIKDALTNNRI